MFVILGTIIVLGCILSGFILEKGNFDLILSAAPPRTPDVGEVLEKQINTIYDKSTEGQF